MPNILSVYAKVERAQTHLDELDVAINEFAQSQDVKVSGKDDPENGQYVVTVTAKVGDPPILCAVIAGEVVSCLRSSLDYIAHQLATVNTPIPSSSICFPVYGKDSAQTQDAIARKTHGIPDAAVSIMKALQPYHGGDAYRRTHLWRLNRLWNIDKHRHIPLHSDFTQVDFPRMPRDIATIADVSTDGHIMRGTVRFPISAKQYIDPKPPLWVNVQFGHDRDGVIVTRKDLRDMNQFVRDHVVPQFAGFFGTE